MRYWISCREQPSTLFRVCGVPGAGPVTTGDPQTNQTQLHCPGAWSPAGRCRTRRSDHSCRRGTAGTVCHRDVCSAASGALECSGHLLKGRAAPWDCRGEARPCTSVSLLPPAVALRHWASAPHPPHSASALPSSQGLSSHRGRAATFYLCNVTQLTNGQYHLVAEFLLNGSYSNSTCTIWQ